MRKRKYTDEQLKIAVLNSRSIRQILSKLGLKEAGGNYYHTKKKCKELNIDLSHLVGRGWKKGNSTPVVVAKPLNKILKKNSEYRSSELRIRLIKEKYKKAKCESCGRKTWLKHKIPLELHHINGIKNDNRLKNLKLLCPNCHAMTDNYRGKNIKIKT